MNKETFNKVIVGIIVGIILPVLGSFIFFYLKNDNVVWNTFLTYATTHFYLFSPFLKLGAIFNLIPFFVFDKIDMPKASRGVIWGTLFWFVILVLLYAYDRLVGA